MTENIVFTGKRVQKDFAEDLSEGIPRKNRNIESKFPSLKTSSESKKREPFLEVGNNLPVSDNAETNSPPQKKKREKVKYIQKFKMAKSNKSFLSPSKPSHKKASPKARIPGIAQKVDSTEKPFLSSEGEEASLDSEEEEFERILHEPPAEIDNKYTIDDWTEIQHLYKPAPKFKGKGGPKFPANLDKKTATPLDLFNLFFDDEAIENLVKWTNRYAEMVSRDPHSFANRRLKDKDIYLTKKMWKEVNFHEMKMYMALIISFGIHSNCEMEDNWSEDDILKTCYNKYMSRNRFMLIHRFFHASDPESKSKNKLAKVKDLTDVLEERWRKYFHPFQNIALDESMVPFNGKLSFKQFCPMKPHRHGIKAFVVSDSETGYAYRAEIYVGKKFDQTREYSLAVDVGIKLTEGLENMNHHMFCDRYYTCVELVQRLKDRGIFTTGTIKEDRRGLPELLKDDNMEPNEMRFYKKPDETLLMVWKPKKRIMMLSNFTSAMKNLEYVNEAGEKVFSKPECAIMYSKYMHGVDRLNQMCAYYRFPHRSIKWWRSLFYFYLEVCLTNSLILYKLSGHPSVGAKEFRLEIVKTILKSSMFGNQYVGNYPLLGTVEDTKHLPKRLPLHDEYFDSTRESRRRCRNCRKMTQFYCTGCSGVHKLFVPLCLPDCFREFHLFI